MEKKCINCHQPMRLVEDKGTWRLWRCESDECKNLSATGHVDETEINIVDTKKQDEEIMADKISQFRNRGEVQKIE
jgi:hypothetical protein